MVNLRRELRDLLRNFGDRCLVLTKASEQPCSCANSLTLNGRPDCPHCLGSGRLLQAHAAYCRSNSSSASDMLPKNLLSGSVGMVPVGLRQWYFEFSEQIERYDLLVFCDWNGDQPVFDSNSAIYRVCNVEPLQGDHGRTEFNKISSQSDPLNAQIKLQQIQQQGNFYLAVKEVL
jgi:hypothetical protein